MAEWPGGARGALSLSFDNLGVDEDSSAATGLPGLLEALAERELSATFFCEGVNAEREPDALRAIAAGHEVAYHAWLHEQWGDLSAAEQAANLARGVAAFGELGIDLSGFRPPGGQLGEGGIEALRGAGFTYASPAGAGAGVEAGVALLPFQWRHVDATTMLPGLDPVREEMTGSGDQIDPDTLTTYLSKEIEENEQRDEFISIVLHLPLLDWLGESNLATILNKLSSTRSWVGRCDQLAGYVLERTEQFDNATALDRTTWT